MRFWEVGMQESWGIVWQDTGLQFLVQRDIVLGEAVDLTGDVGHSIRDADDGDEYQSSSSAEEEEFQEDESQLLCLVEYQHSVELFG